MAVRDDQMVTTPATPVASAGSRSGDGRGGPSDGWDRWRHALTWLLGGVWLLDAALQYQPYMFTSAFPREAIRPAGAGSPEWVRGPVDWSASLMAHHIVVLNAVFATVQLLLAVGLFRRTTVRLALAGSVVWSLLVWWLGEGLGGILTGPLSPLAGLPGAVLLYAVIAILVWPPRASSSAGPPARSVATASPFRAAGAVAVWLGLWGWFAVEALLPANRASGAVHDLVAGMADGEPTWVGAINTWAAKHLDGRGEVVSIALAASFILIGLSVLVPRLTRAGLLLAVALSLAIWVIAQDFGALFTGQATDPNSGLLLALLALCYWPATRGRPGRRA